MQQELIKLLNILERMDNDPLTCVAFYQELKEKNAKYEIIQKTVFEVMHDMYMYDAIETGIKTRQLLERINLRYSYSNHNFCWKSHETHFHMTFCDWINCPMTCIAEIREFFEKLVKGD